MSVIKHIFLTLIEDICKAAETAQFPGLFGKTDARWAQETLEKNPQLPAVQIWRRMESGAIACLYVTQDYDVSRVIFCPEETDARCREQAELCTEGWDKSQPYAATRDERDPEATREFFSMFSDAQVQEAIDDPLVRKSIEKWDEKKKRAEALMAS